MSYDKNKILSKLIENKRVAIIGPSSYLTGKGIGPILDKFDVVCRVNYIIANNLVEDYGNRTDILFYNCCTRSLGKMKKHLNTNPNVAKKIKMVVCPVVKVLGPEKWKTWGPDYISPVISNFNSINIYNNDFHWIGMNNYRYLYNLIGCVEPNSGTLAMSMILEYNPKEFLITGFSFYDKKCGSHFNNYPLLPPNWKGTCGHPQGSQIDFFKKYILSKNVKIDLFLNTLLKTNHSNIQHF